MRRAIIDEVMVNIKGGFEEFGVDEDVLAELQNVLDSSRERTIGARDDPGAVGARIWEPGALASNGHVIASTSIGTGSAREHHGGAPARS
ncbi:hypothetical protein FRC07_011349 [Ceratobasidium sp. 392]|nr:hypothetical protein FRC07_011349 [Ceratobasidium sp. 392]